MLPPARLYRPKLSGLITCEEVGARLSSWIAERLKWPRRPRCGRFGWALDVVHGRGRTVMRTFSRRAFVMGLGMLSIPLFALAQEKREGSDQNREEKKEEAEERKEEAKDKAEDAVDDRDKVVDGPGTDNSQDRRQDRRRDAVK